MSDDKRFTLRMNPELFEQVKRSANVNRRSVAKEIEYILFQWAGLEPESSVEPNPSFKDNKPSSLDDK